jgi:hypothetical protein
MTQRRGFFFRFFRPWLVGWRPIRAGIFLQAFFYIWNSRIFPTSLTPYGRVPLVRAART